MKLFLTGEPGVGKSTLLSAILDGIKDKQGFLTREIKPGEARTGFVMTDSSGNTTVLASVDSKSDIRVSRYGVNTVALDQFIDALPTIRQNTLLYIDEVGQMQLYSEGFKALVNEYLDKPNLFIGTLSKIYHDRFTDIVRGRDDVTIVEVTAENRKELLVDISAKIAKINHCYE